MTAGSLVGRTLSWLEANRRVLAQVQDPRVPHLERLKFLAILSSNLDEFFMVCGVELKRAVHVGSERATEDRRSSWRATTAARIRALVDAQQRYFLDDIQPRLAATGTLLLRPKDTSEAQRRYLGEHFRRAILPMLTPFAVDPGHPFPYLSNHASYLVASIKPWEPSTLPHTGLSLVHIPRSALPRFIPLPHDTADHAFMLLEDVIRLHLPTLYHDHDILTSHAIRVTRASSRRPLERRLGTPVRLEHEGELPPEILVTLLDELDLSPDDVYGGQSFTGFSDLFQLYAAVSGPRLLDASPPHPMSSIATAPDIWSVARGDEAQLQPASREGWA